MVVTASYLNKEVRVIIDRPLGSKHPDHGFLYLVNYGYVPNTISGDGEELDAYVLGVSEPIKEFSGTCIAYIKRLDDNDDKLIIVPTGESYTDQEIKTLVKFREEKYKSLILRK
ncbi:MAG: inorganic diphosphatase [Bacilli bacterium]|nr:inorganic diphosphatase [Bacilli bacterium]